MPALLSCLVNAIIKHFFFQRWNTHHVWCESLCLFWQNVGEVKANKTNKQVSQQTAPCVHACLCVCFWGEHTHTPIFVNLCIHPPTRHVLCWRCFYNKNYPALLLSIEASISAAIKLDFQRFLLSTILNRLKKELRRCPINQVQCNDSGFCVPEPAFRIWKNPW